MSPGVTSFPIAETTRWGLPVEMFGESSAIFPSLTPISSCSRRPMLGSITVPPLTTRSYKKSVLLSEDESKFVLQQPLPAVKALRPEPSRDFENWRRVGISWSLTNYLTLTRQLFSESN